MADLRGIPRPAGLLLAADIFDMRGIDTGARFDGFMATFDGPARAIRCAQRIIEDAHDVELEVRAGMHTLKGLPDTWRLLRVDG
jgi:hypothetical protein